MARWLEKAGLKLKWRRVVVHWHTLEPCGPATREKHSRPSLVRNCFGDTSQARVGRLPLYLASGHGKLSWAWSLARIGAYWIKSAWSEAGKFATMTLRDF